MNWSSGIREQQPVSTRQFPLMQKIRVIGVPRSGTNLAKYLLESHTDFRCYFNDGWWKHAVIPALYEGREPKLDPTPTVVMFRDPVAQMIAFFRFSEKGRRAIYGDATGNGLGYFLRSPVHTDAPRGFRYRFPTPIAYWEQFYWAALQWEAPAKFFVSLDALKQDPSLLMRLARRLNPRLEAVANLQLPGKYLGRNGDVHVSEGFVFEENTSREIEDAEAQALKEWMQPGDLERIQAAEVTRLYGMLQEKQFDV